MLFTNKKIEEVIVERPISKEDMILKFIHDKLDNYNSIDILHYSNNSVRFIDNNTLYEITLVYNFNNTNNLDMKATKNYVNDIEDEEDDEYDKHLSISLKTDSVPYCYHKFHLLINKIKHQLDKKKKDEEIDSFYNYIFEE